MELAGSGRAERLHCVFVCQSHNNNFKNIIEWKENQFKESTSNNVEHVETKKYFPYE